MVKKFCKVSVIVPVYNIQNWLNRCITSLINQTMQDIEIILVNDGSTDNSALICSQYKKRDPRVRLVNKSNGGLSDARNYGLKFCKGKYVIFVDGDDYVDQNYVKYLYEAIDYNQSDVAMCGYYEVDQKENIIKEVLPNIPNAKDTINGKELYYYFHQPNGVVDQVVWNKIYKFSLFKNLKFEKGRYYEDGYFIAPLCWNAKKISIVRKCLYNYVQRKDSITHSTLTVKKFKDSRDSYLYRINFFKTRNDYFYKLSVGDYKNWIIFTLTYTKISGEEKKHLKQQYRKYKKVIYNLNWQDAIKNLLGSLNLDVLIFFYKLKKYIK